jgi:glycosyltransferase involved in cell wall biosynthesis
MGAPQSRLSETAVGLKQLGWDVCIVTAMPNYPTGKIFPGYRRKLLKRERIDDIPVYRYVLYASNSKKRLPRIVSMLSFSISSLAAVFSLRKFNPDYILTESPPLTLAATGVLLAKLTGARHIMNVSDIWPLSARELGAVADGFLHKMLKRLENRLYSSSFACTGQSQQIADYLKFNGCDRVHLFRNGVDVSRFDHSVVKRNDEGFKIVYAGLLGVAQGILALVQNINFKEIGAEFHIYGDGAEKKQLEIFLESHPDSGVFLHEVVDRSHVPTIISQFNLTIIPLVKPLYGAVPSKIYEAMAAGLPMLFAGGGEGAELVKKYETGWVCEPSDFVAMKTALLDISKLGNVEFERVQRNCVNAAQQVFDRKIQIAQLSRFLKEAE